MDDQEKVITVYTCGSNVEAAIIGDALEDAGIRFMLANETFSTIYPIGHTSLGEIQILVFERDECKALEVINNMQSE